MKSSLDMIFYKVVYHHIIYMCDFFVNLNDFFAVIYTGFHEHCGFHHIRSHYSMCLKVNLYFIYVYKFYYLADDTSAVVCVN